MKIKDLTITCIPLVFLVSLIVIAVRPPSDTVQIQNELSPPSDPNIKEVKQENKEHLIPENHVENIAETN